MAKPLIEFLTEQCGACCQWGFMKRYDGLTIDETARLIGVSPRTIDNTRAMIADGGLACRRKSNCEWKKEKR